MTKTINLPEVIYQDLGSVSEESASIPESQYRLR